MSQKLTCREILESLSEYIDAELDPSLCREIEEHMKDCDPCVAFLNTLKKTVVLYKFSGRDDPMPAEIRVDLHRYLREACAGKGTTG